MDTLQTERRPLTPSELEDLIHFPVGDDTQLAQALKGHERVEFTSSGEFFYKVCVYVVGVEGGGMCTCLQCK